MSLIRTATARNVLLLVGVLLSGSAYSCAVPGDRYYESQRKYQIHMHKEVCTGKDQKEVEKIRAGFKRYCVKHTAKLKGAIDNLKANPDDTQAEIEVSAYRMLVDDNCNPEKAFKSACDDNYKRAIKCGIL